MIAGSLTVVVVRSTITAIGILIMGLAFGATHIESIPAFLFWVVAVSSIFGLLGIIIGLWAKSFEQLNVLTVFFITPLSMVGGVFNTVDHAAGLAALAGLRQSFLLFHQRHSRRHAGRGRNPAGPGRRPDPGACWW